MATWNEEWDGDTHGATIYKHPLPLTQFFTDYKVPHGKDFYNLIFSCYNQAYTATNNFIYLVDTPEEYISNMYIKVNDTGNALEFIDLESNFVNTTNSQEIGGDKTFLDDVFFESNPILISPNGTKYALTVDDSGNLSTLLIV